MSSLFSTPTNRRQRQDSLPGSSPHFHLAHNPRLAATQALAQSVPAILPPLSDDGIFISSPIVGTKEEKLAASYRKHERKRANTVAAQKIILERDIEENKITIFEEILAKLGENHLTFGWLMLYVFDPIYKQGSTRPTAREEVASWAENYVAGVVQDEAQAVTASKVLQIAGTAIEERYVTGFSMLKAGEKMGGLARVATKILNAFATSARNLKSNLPHRAVKRFTVVTPAALALLGEFSHKNNYSRRIMGLYLYATGAQRQTIMVMAHLGISESYQNLTHKPRTNVNFVPPNPVLLAEKMEGLLSIKLSTLRELSGSMRSFARVVASTGLFAASYDNINMVFRAAEQILGRNDSQENGTCTTIFALWKARLEAMQISDLTAAFEKAPPLALMDILLSAPELETMDKGCRHHLHRAQDQGLSHWIVKILAGDQLSIARLRSLLNTRAGHEGGYSGFGWGVWMPGLFHGKIADMHGFFVTHWGVPHCGTRNPGSLSFHNTHLHQSPDSSIIASSVPRVLGPSFSPPFTCSVNFRAMAQTAEGTPPRGDEIFENSCLFLRDALILHEFTDAIKAGDSGHIVLVLKILALSFRGNGRSKYAYAMLHLIHNLTHVWPKPIWNIILHNWLVNPTGNLFSWVEVDLMQEHMNFWIKTIYLAHGSAASWEWLGMVAPCVTALRHLSTSITQIVTTGYTGVHYGYTKSRREATTLVDGGDLPSDPGSALTALSSKVSSSEKLTRLKPGRFTQILGSDQGTKHEPANLSTDINLLMKSLAEHQVYKIKGRVFAEGDGKPDTLADSSANPLVEYNAAFRKLQVRLRWSESESEEVAHAPSGGHADVSGQTEAPQSDADMALPDDADEQSEPDNSDGSGSNTGSEDNRCTVFERKMDETDEATLTRDSAEDIALDMDGDNNDFLFGRSIYVSDSDSDGFVDDLQDLDYFDNY
ncbi:hypothetical protein B0H14DRAFT_2597994 [Mycena olivaceomarginata]|nr:hypothetical protein B0H14DRAFT_2597994 [Mycena olivaceomarginata]